MYIVMACIVIVYIRMAYTVTACAVMACMGMACVYMACVVMAYVVVAGAVVACVVTAYKVTACIRTHAHKHARVSEAVEGVAIDVLGLEVAHVLRHRALLPERRAKDLFSRLIW